VPRLRARAGLTTRWLRLALLLACACGRQVAGEGVEVHPLVVGNQKITVEVVATPADRSRGLQHRESLPDDHGMLFVFPHERVLTFWMKDTPLPLSIAFADAGGRIVRIADMEPLSAAPVSSGQPARFALEMSRGWFERRGVFVGDALARIPRVDVE
jgi:uncharacterized membrane protein (UPF0127 family)